MQNYHANLKLKIAGLLAASVAFLPATSQAEEDAVFSVNIVGFQRQELPDAGQLILSAPPFRVGQTNTLLGVFGTNSLQKSDTLTQCDRIILFDSVGQKYNTWAQAADGKFYRANTLSEWNNGTFTGDPDIPQGEGFWIRSASSGRSLNYVGNVAIDDSVSIELRAGLHILAYPFSSEVNVQELGFSSSASRSDLLTSADRLSIFENGSFRTYALASDGLWYSANTLSEWNDLNAQPAQLVINPGEAFFYTARQPFTWVETNKYYNLMME